MIYSGTYSTVIATTLQNTSGLVGTLGVRILDTSLSTVVARRTTGIAEFASSGFYVATIDLTALTTPLAPGHYFPFWDDGSVTPGHVTAEDLLLHKTTTLSAALREINNVAISHNAENISVGFFVA